MRKDIKNFIGWYNTVIGCPSNKRAESKLMKEIKPGYYSIMPEMVAQQKTINLHSDGLGIRFMIPFPTSLL